MALNHTGGRITHVGEWYAQRRGTRIIFAPSNAPRTLIGYRERSHWWEPPIPRVWPGLTRCNSGQDETVFTDTASEHLPAIRRTVARVIS